MTLRTQALLACLGPLDDGLDVLLLFSSGLVVAPPVRSLVFAVKAEVSASLALGLAFITLLAPEPTREAALDRVSIMKGDLGGDLPDRDRRCIFEAFVEGESCDEGAAFFSVEEAIVDIGRDLRVNVHKVGVAHKVK